MPRTAPIPVTEVPGNYQTSALWNAQVRAMADWAFGTGVPRFKGYATTTQSIPNGTTSVAVALDSEVYDSDGGHSTVSNTSRYTVQVAGVYAVFGTLCYGTNSTGARSLSIWVNGNFINGDTIQGTPPSGASWTGNIAVLTGSLAVGDYIELATWQTSGAAFGTNVNTQFGPMLSCYWISP